MWEKYCSFEEGMFKEGVLQAVQHQEEVLNNLLSDLLFLRHEFSVYKAHNL